MAQGGRVFRRVGVLGGMGPEATVLLMQRLIEAVPAADDADHLPLIVDQNPQVPSRLRRVIDRTGDDPAPVLAGMAQRLQVAGAEALAMPCNTAHHYAPSIRSAVSIPLLDMVALSVERAQDLAGAGGKVGILASPAVRHISLFDSALYAVGLSPVYVENEVEMLSIIRRIKAGGPDENSRAALRAASCGLLARGARVQMVACTEFSLISGAVDPQADAFDTLDCLVQAIVAFATSDRPS